MLATRWEPFAEVNRLSRELDRMFGSFNYDGAARSSFRAYPAINLWQDEHNFYLESELPGCELEDIDLSVNASELTIKGSRKPPQLDNGQWLRQERGYVEFSRTVELPEEVDTDNISANLRDGVLTITLGKQAQVKPRRIEIQSN